MDDTGRKMVLNGIKAVTFKLNLLKHYKPLYTTYYITPFASPVSDVD